MKLIKTVKHPNIKDYLIVMLYSLCRLIEALIELVSLGFLTTELYDYVTFECFNDEGE